MNIDSEAAISFEPHRRYLAGLAYRMLGSVSEAEDIVQDAYLRWHGTDRTTVENARAFLSRIVTRLCLDYLKSAKVQRETYVGQWLPEPVIEENFDSDSSDDLSVALLLALERLSPLERAAFLLHDVFDMSFSEISQIIDRNEAACRQLASRARENVRASKPRFQISDEEGSRIAEAFFAAAKSGNVDDLQVLLAEDAAVYADGGGRKPSALNPLFGRERVVKFFAGLAKRMGEYVPPVLYKGKINGLPGLITMLDTLQTTAFEIEDGKIKAIYIVRNPEKLGHLSEFTGS